jgi:hypothetical protein
MRFSASLPAYTSNRSGKTTRTESPIPTSEEQRRKEERCWQLTKECDASLPYKRFSAQKREERGSALGSTIYKIMTAAQPYEDLTDEEVVALFEEQKFPLVDNLPCGGVIKRCWHGKFDSAEEAHRSIKAEI